MSAKKSSDNPSVPITILRNQKGFSQLVTRRASEGAPFRLFERPLSKKSNQQLWAAWTALENVTELNDTVVADAIAIVLSSVRRPLYEDKTELELSALDAVPTLVKKPTARHPRAYKGTKYKPPKPASAIQAVNLTPCLLNSFLFRDLARRFKDHWIGAKKILIEKWCLSAKKLDRLWESGSFSSQPYYGYWFPNLKARRNFHEHFVLWLLPTVIDNPGRANSLWKLFQSLTLANNPQLLAAIVYLIKQESAKGLDWLLPKQLLKLPSQRRLIFAQELIGAKIVGTAGAFIPDELLDELNYRNEDDEIFRKWLSWYLRSLKIGANSEYLLSGMRLFREFEIKDFPDETEASQEVDLALLTDIGYHFIVEKEMASSYFVKQIWMIGGLLPRFSEFARKVFSAKCTDECKHSLLDTFYYLSDMKKERLFSVWRCFLEFGLDGFCSRANEIKKKYQLKAAFVFYDIYEMALAGADFEQLTKRALQLIDIICREPFNPLNKARYALGLMADKLTNSQWLTFITLPKKTVHALERSCHYENNQSLIARGVRAFIDEDCDTFIELLGNAPKTLLRLLLTLAKIEYQSRRRAIRVALSHPLANISTLADDELLSVLHDVESKKFFAGLVSKRLKKHICHQLELKPNSLQRHLETLRSKHSLLLMKLIDSCTKEELQQQYPEAKVLDDAKMHAMAFPLLIYDNRRSLKRFLRAHWRGDSYYVRRHPKTKTWLAKHPNFNARRWIRGYELEAVHSKFGKVTVATENNPLEVLKMGSYARSCLGLGGKFAYSAAAAVLDFNKRVVYCRAQSGKVVGRQLVTITEKEKLAVFRIYVNEDDEELEKIFGSFDYEFANYLGTEVFTYCEKNCPQFLAGSDDCEDCEFVDYEIVSILSHDWWDDDIWEPRPPATERST